VALEHEAEVLARAAGRKSPVDRARDLLKLGTRARLLGAYRRVFLTAEGALTPDAALVIDDLASIAQLGRAAVGWPSSELHEREGARSVVLHLLSRIDRKALREVARKMRESEDE
jgi:hypothetical protein